MPPTVADSFQRPMAASDDADAGPVTVSGPPIDVGRIVNVLSVGQLLRTGQYAISSMAVNTMALQLTGNNHAAVVAHISRASTFGSLLELLSSPFVGALSDKFGRKPLLLIAGMAKFVPYVLLLVAPSMGAIFALNALQEVAYQLYRLSDASILADCIKDPKRLAVAQTQVRPPQPGPLPRR